MKRIHLLRHGRTEANDRRLYCGSTDLPLSPAGVEELKAKIPAARELKLDGVKVYISPMRRAAETLAILWEREGIPEPDLREMDFGIFEMKGYEELKDTPAFQRWCQGDNEKNVCPGGESGAQMSQRVLAAFRRIADRDGDALLVFHGGPIAAVMEHLFPEEGKNRWQWQPKNGSGYTILLDENKVVCYNSFLE